jgi:hypothetical protein
MCPVSTFASSEVVYANPYITHFVVSVTSYGLSVKAKLIGFIEHSPQILFNFPKHFKREL